MCLARQVLHSARLPMNHGKINLLAISVGNSRTRFAAFAEGKLVEQSTLANSLDPNFAEAIDASWARLREAEDATVLLASVNPPVAEDVASIAKDRTKRDVYRVEKDVKIPIGRQLDREALVGEDRLLNAAAAYDVLKQACVVVDAGTAITVDFVDGAGTFHGGAIAAGAQMQLDALAQRTAQLPELEVSKPSEAIGHSTVEAMKCGVFYGLRGMVRELTERYAESVGHFPAVVATGGDADLLFREYELVDRVVPDLTLHGLAVTVRVASEQAGKGD